MLTVSLKENIQMVKNELNTEEQFFEKAVQTERFVKKYKKPLIGLIAAAILAVGGGAAYDIYTQHKIDQSNAAFNTLMADPNDQSAQKQLRDLNPKLYDVWSLSRALKSKDQDALRALEGSDALAVADLSAYELAAIQEDAAGLQRYAEKSGALLKDLSVMEEAVLLMDKGEIASAKAKLSMIDIHSPLYQTAQSLAHYGVDKE
jgi:hypothetical protein